MLWKELSILVVTLVLFASAKPQNDSNQLSLELNAQNTRSIRNSELNNDKQDSAIDEHLINGFITRAGLNQSRPNEDSAFKNVIKWVYQFLAKLMAKIGLDFNESNLSTPDRVSLKRLFDLLASNQEDHTTDNSSEITSKEFINSDLTFNTQTKTEKSSGVGNEKRDRLSEKSVGRKTSKVKHLEMKSGKTISSEITEESKNSEFNLNIEGNSNKAQDKSRNEYDETKEKKNEKTSSIGENDRSMSLDINQNTQDGTDVTKDKKHNEQGGQMQKEEEKIMLSEITERKTDINSNKQGNINRIRKESRNENDGVTKANIEKTQLSEKTEGSKSSDINEDKGTQIIGSKESNRQGEVTERKGEEKKPNKGINGNKSSDINEDTQGRDIIGSKESNRQGKVIERRGEGTEPSKGINRNKSSNINKDTQGRNIIGSKESNRQGGLTDRSGEKTESSKGIDGNKSSDNNEDTQERDIIGSKESNRQGGLTDRSGEKTEPSKGIDGNKSSDINKGTQGRDIIEIKESTREDEVIERAGEKTESSKGIDGNKSSDINEDTEGDNGRIRSKELDGVFETQIEKGELTKTSQENTNSDINQNTQGSIDNIKNTPQNEHNGSTVTKSGEMILNDKTSKTSYLNNNLNTRESSEESSSAQMKEPGKLRTQSLTKEKGKTSTVVSQQNIDSDKDVLTGKDTGKSSTKKTTEHNRAIDKSSTKSVELMQLSKENDESNNLSSSLRQHGVTTKPSRTSITKQSSLGRGDKTISTQSSEKNWILNQNHINQGSIRKTSSTANIKDSSSVDFESNEEGKESISINIAKEDRIFENTSSNDTDLRPIIRNDGYNIHTVTLVSINSEGEQVEDKGFAIPIVVSGKIKAGANKEFWSSFLSNILKRISSASVPENIPKLLVGGMESDTKLNNLLDSIIQQTVYEDNEMKRS